MTRTASLRCQHKAAEAMIDEIFAAARSYSSENDAYPLSLKLARLAGILRTHFALEREMLYPAMIESDHRQAAIVARVFRTEVDQLSGQFEHFMARWATSQAIASAFRQFEFEAGMLFAALRDRIAREDSELLPLAELAAGTVSHAVLRPDFTRRARLTA